jgi:hypothetical protein
MNLAEARVAPAKPPVPDKFMLTALTRTPSSERDSHVGAGVGRSDNDQRDRRATPTRTGCGECETARSQAKREMLGGDLWTTFARYQPC